MIIAHRGGKPENTLTGFATCVFNKVDAIEFDVHLTKDNHLVVTHDYCINSIKITDMNLKDIKQQNQDIPLLLEVLDTIRESARDNNLPIPTINIEIKPFGISGNVASGIKQFIDSQSVLQLSDFLFTSFLHTEVLKIRGTLPEARIGFLYRSWPVDIIKSLERYNIDIVVLSKHLTIPDTVKQLKDNNVKVWVYTVNDYDEAKRLLEDCGVSGVITDIPCEMKNKFVSLI